MSTVSFVNAHDGWAVGTGSDTSSAGTIVATTDGGATWRPQSAGTDWALSGVTFVDARHGWLPEGESIYATTDGGVTWTKHDAGMPVTAVSFVDDLHGYAVGPGGAMATTVDGGATWQVCGTTTPAAGLPTPPFGHVGVSPLIVGLAFPDATHGWAVAGHTILATTDGGDTWTGRTVSADLTGVSFPDTAHGWAVGATGLADQRPTILHTDDGGLSWTTQYRVRNLPGGFRGFTAVDALDAGRAWVTGASDRSPARPARPIVGTTTDGGAHWKFVRLNEHGVADAVSFVDAKHGWVVCDRYIDHAVSSIILRTTDGGLTWRLQHATRRETALRDITFVDRLHGWAVGQSNGASGACIVLTTRNGGRTWSKQRLSCPVGWGGLQVRFVGRLHGWVVCGSVIWATVDGGRHWRLQRPGGEVLAVAFVDRSHGWAIADAADWSLGPVGILTMTTGGFRPGP